MYKKSLSSYSLIFRDTHPICDNDGDDDNFLYNRNNDDDDDDKNNKGKKLYTIATELHV